MMWQKHKDRNLAGSVAYASPSSPANAAGSAKPCGNSFIGAVSHELLLQNKDVVCLCEAETTL